MRRKSSSLVDDLVALDASLGGASDIRPLPRGADDRVRHLRRAGGPSLGRPPRRLGSADELGT